MPLPEDKKLEALGLLSNGMTAKEVSRQLDMPYTQVRKWVPEAKSLQSKKDLSIVLDVDKALLHDLAETTKDKLNELVEDGDELVEGILENISNVKILQDDLQLSAILVLKKINSLIESCTISDDVLVLVEAIAKLQVAFFAKGANVNVLNLNNNERSGTNINEFKSLQRNM